MSTVWDGDPLSAVVRGGPADDVLVPHVLAIRPVGRKADASFATRVAEHLPVAFRDPPAARVPGVDVLVAHPVGDRLLAAGHALEHRDHLPLPARDVGEDLADPPDAAPGPPHGVVAGAAAV